MKTIKNILRKSKKAVLISLLSGMTIVAFSQGPPPPPGTDGGGATPNSGNQLGGAAHVGGGVLILLTLAVAYGGRKLVDLRKNESLEA